VFPDASAEGATHTWGLNRAFSAGNRHIFVPEALPHAELNRAFGAERHADCASHSEATTVVR